MHNREELAVEVSRASDRSSPYPRQGYYELLQVGIRTLANKLAHPLRITCINEPFEKWFSILSYGCYVLFA
jgi:hypothetical protein